MARNQIRTGLLSRDIAGAIKYFSYNNITEFWRRHKTELFMSRVTFHRAIIGENVYEENADIIENLAIRLGIADKQGGSIYLVKNRIIPILLKLIDQMIVCDHDSDELIVLFAKLRVFMRDSRTALLL